MAEMRKVDKRTGKNFIVSPFLYTFAFIERKFTIYVNKDFFNERKENTYFWNWLLEDEIRQSCLLFTFTLLNLLPRTKQLHSSWTRSNVPCDQEKNSYCSEWVMGII